MSKNTFFFKSFSAEYASLSKCKNINPIFIEPLQFEFVNIELLKDKLVQQTVYDGLIITSPRAADAIGKLELDLSGWKDKKVYTVGKASGNKIRTDLNLIPLGESSGNAKSLGDIIINENNYGTKFLFPCGNLKSDVLVNKLTQAHIVVDEITVYITSQNDTLNQKLNEMSTSFKPDAYVFFSPSGVEYFVEVMKTSKQDFQCTPCFAIGTSTAEKLRDLNINSQGIAMQPVASSVIAMLDIYFNG